MASFFGDWFTTIALYAIVHELSDSASAVAAVLIAKTLPVFLISPIAGSIVDRYDRRSVLLATDFLRAGLTVGLVGAYLVRSLELLFLVEVIRVCVAGVFIPGRTAALPQVVSRDELGAALALSGGTWSVMLALGAAAGGVVTELLGPVGALIIDGGTFLVSAAFLWGLPALPPRDAGDADDADVRMRTALRWVAQRPKLSLVLLLKAGLAFDAGVLMVLPLYGNGVFPATASAGLVGLLYFGRGVGSMLGSLGLRRVLGDGNRTMERAIPWLFALQVLAYGGLAGAPGLGVATACYLVGGLGMAGVWVFSSVLAQRALPRAIRGRLFAAEFGAMTLVSSAGSFVAGQLIDRAGLSPRDVVAYSAVLLVVPGLAWVGMRWRRPEVLTAVDA